MVEEKTKLPGMLLMIAAIFPILMSLLSLAVNVLSIGLGATADMGGGDPAMAMFSGTVGLLSAIFGLFFYGFVAFGGYKLMKGESWGIALAACIMALLPCNLCCILTLPIGIWGLVVLNDQQVKAGFRG